MHIKVMLLAFWRIWWLLTIALSSTVMGRTCPSMDIRNNVTNFNLLRGCSVIDGFLHIVLIDKSSQQDFENVTFPDLREVTEYVLFYQVNGLTSLGEVFPNLAVIRGEKLFLDYSFIVFQMPDLKTLKFKSFIILRGSVVIANNKNLCYDNTIDWDKVAVSGVREYLFPNDTEKNCSCPSCSDGLCWSEKNCQLDLAESSCHQECVGGCTGSGPSNCVSCRHLYFRGKCVPECPDGYYSFNSRHCISKEDCINSSSTYHKMRRNDGAHLVWFIWGNSCVTECPPKFEKTPDGKSCQRCSGMCKKVCSMGNVDSLQAAQNLRDCTHIDGNLEIHIGTGKPEVVAKELEENLGMIEEIEGNLRIIHSFPLDSLGFFKNLKVIHGYKDKKGTNNLVNHSLFVLDNQNLKEIWNWDTRPAGRNFKILNGYPFFHYNPMLCYKHIEELTSIAGIQDIKTIEITRESNGGRFACNKLSLNVTVHLVYENAIALAIEQPEFTNMAKYYQMMRFVAYYMEAPHQNVTELNTNECSESKWKMHDISGLNEPFDGGPPNGSIYHIITRLEPYTQYAFYVKTYTVDSTGIQSPIQYVRTLPSQPKMPAKLEGISNSSSEILLHWSPPEKPNGKLVSYVVSGFIQEYHPDFLSTRNFCKKPYVHIPPTTPPPKFMTHVKTKDECVCNVSTIPIEDEFEPPLVTTELCETADELAKSPPLYEYDGCHKYVYETLEQPPFLKIYENDNIGRYERGISMIEEDDDLVLNEDVEMLGRDGSLVKFHRIFPAEANVALIGGLRHFSTYTIEVKACRERVEGELQRSANCSISAFITLKTLSDSKADEIVGGLRVQVENRTAILNWVPPKSNGMTVSYQIELTRTDRDEMKPMPECIPVQDAKNGAFMLEDLEFGEYKIRLRSQSLAGPGKFTAPVYFTISGQFAKDMMAVAVLTVVILLVILVSVTLAVWYYRKNLMINQPVLIASVNPEYCGLLHFDEEWELPRERVHIVKELKRGNFGVVCEGLLVPEGRVVAVKKAINENCSPHEIAAFLNEAMVMKQFVDGPHIVKLIGVVSRDVPALVVMEMMANGDLKTYLRECRNKNVPSSQRMLLMAAQIADGMAYLEAAKFVHRDLAARNCMVSDNGVVKIGDFGMTRDIYETDYYRKGNKGLLPIRWMAPESLNDGVFTSKSDAWSYGIVLWEMATLASQPYQGLSNEQVLQFVISGNKLELPPVYPKPFKSLTAWCWRWKPKFRPSFIEILRELEEYMTVSFRQVSFFNSEAGLQASRGAHSSETVPEELNCDTVASCPSPTNLMD
ncbi:insulin receptor-like isoform X2 [Cimex lectularius]|uniref:receptor protein-tyrosine kinase n=1 Tax=Cimex lectularius TaxID=79782 RepID=A0A8I6SPY1_CIMLE|nr:insulin receptor-like isoform X2 [Cimex lectularius]